MNGVRSLRRETPLWHGEPKSKKVQLIPLNLGNWIFDIKLCLVAKIELIKIYSNPHLITLWGRKDFNSVRSEQIVNEEMYEIYISIYIDIYIQGESLAS